MFEITKGDDATIPVRLKRGGVTFVISGSALIQAVLTGTNKTTILSAEVSVNLTETGTDLANSLIIVKFSEAQTTAILATGTCLLEVQVADPLKDTWRAALTVEPGNIA